MRRCLASFLWMQCASKPKESARRWHSRRAFLRDFGTSPPARFSYQATPANRVAGRMFVGCRCRFMARNGPPAMSAVWSLSGGKRTWRLRAPTSEFDPSRTSEAKTAMRVTVNPSYDASPIKQIAGRRCVKGTSLSHNSRTDVTKAWGKQSVANSLC
jgi:hypothetical protein